LAKKKTSRDDDAFRLALSAIGKSRVFGEIPFSAQKKLAASARLETYRTRSLLQAAGEPVRHLRFVVAGQLDFVARNVMGDEVTIGAIGRGGWATWLAVFDSKPPVDDFYSARNAQFLTFPAADVRKTAQAYPHIYARMIEEIGVRFRNVIEWLEQSTILDTECRIAKLLQLAARQSSRNVARVEVSQEQLARLARCSRQTVNAALKSLEAEGLIVVGYRRIDTVSNRAIDAFIERRHARPRR
jgi:CRP-like cAMP-binding protein